MKKQILVTGLLVGAMFLATTDANAQFKSLAKKAVKKKVKKQTFKSADLNKVKQVAGQEKHSLNKVNKLGKSVKSGKVTNVAKNKLKTKTSKEIKSPKLGKKVKF